MNNHEKAIATYMALQERKHNEVQLAKQVAKLAKKKDKEVIEYSITNVQKVKRRMR